MACTRYVRHTLRCPYSISCHCNISIPRNFRGRGGVANTHQTSPRFHPYKDKNKRHAILLYDIRWSIIFECFKGLDTKQFMLSIHNYFINASTHLTPLESILWYVGHYHNALPYHTISYHYLPYLVNFPQLIDKTF